MNLENQVLEIMRAVFGIDDITPEISQKNCERWDSLRHLTMASELEDVFDIELEPEEIAEMTDFSRVINMINSKLQ